jgi:hypothetical protein
LVRVAGNVVALLQWIGPPGTDRIQPDGIAVGSFHNYFVGSGDNAMLVNITPASKIVTTLTRSVSEGANLPR